MPLLVDKKREQFQVLLLDRKNRVMRAVMVSQGSLTASVVHPREVFNPAIRDSAAAVIFVHNHPSGDPQPSQEDRVLTTRLAEAGKLLGIQVLDHIIVGRHTYMSFADEGLLDARG
jgi:DNA repair protein RadC